MKSRYQIQFSASRLEAEKIRKLIQQPATTIIDKEKMPYRLFTKLWNLFSIVSIVLGGALLIIGYEAYSKLDEFSGLKNIGFLCFCGLLISLICLYITFRIEQGYIRKNEEKEQSNPDRLVKVKINRKYIDSITKETLVRMFWSNIEECYIEEEYMFIFAFGGEGTVIPARVLSEGEFKELHQFVMEQIASHKSK
ncbi:YcxB family protein [Providencia rettgeri]|nr:YcxB family protein [Providencia rettgeri]